MDLLVARETESVSVPELIAEHTNDGLVIVKLDIEGECRALSAVPLEHGGNLAVAPSGRAGARLVGRYPHMSLAA